MGWAMHIYLPIAEVSVNAFLLLGLGGMVGVLSGMFGVGGGFLMTPLLIFSGIPPAVAVGTEAAQIVASSVSGAIAQWRRGVTRGRHQGRWVGLLISRHATSLYEGRQGDLPELDQFLQEQLAQQQRWMGELNVTEEEVATAYAMIRWTDWLSLILCWRRLPDDGQPIRVGEGSDGITYQAMRRPDGTVTLNPCAYRWVCHVFKIPSQQILYFVDSRNRNVQHRLRPFLEWVHF